MNTLQASRPTKAVGVGSASSSRRTDSRRPVEKIADLFPWPSNLADGSCKYTDNADSFSDPFTEEDLDTAIAYCEFCPIRKACHNIGVTRREDGVYGGVLLRRGQPTVLPKYRRP